jgi:hypothetical protein
MTGGGKAWRSLGMNRYGRQIELVTASNRTCTVAITAQIHLGDDAGQLISAG